MSTPFRRKPSTSPLRLLLLLLRPPPHRLPLLPPLPLPVLAQLRP
jgi:hypothetical protein